MGYIGRTMNICLILFTILAAGSQGQYYSNRDIILTPNHLKTYPGKVLYYRPREQGTPAEEKPNTIGGSATVPWEDVLKETVFLALNDNKTSLQQQSSGSTDNALLLAKRQQKAIYNAPYVGAVDLSVPRFGDIVELAHGRLEHEGDDSYVFVQQQDEPSNEQPQRNVTALWKVERIRHRDDLRGHRFELKFTVAPSKSWKVDSNEESSELPGNRTFIVRDEDYPKYFATLISPNAIQMRRKNDQQLYDRTFFDLMQPQQTHQSSQFGAFSSATRFYRPAVAPQQQTITFGQYLMQSLLSGGDAPKFHHHHHHFMPSKLVSPAFHGGLAAATSNRIKFPDSFTGSSHSVPKFYQHIHFQRPSIAPLAPTALPGSYLFHHGKDVHAPAPSNVHQDYTKLVDLRGATAPSQQNSAVEAKPTSSVGTSGILQKTQPTAQNQVHQQSPPSSQKPQQKPQQFFNQQQQQQQQQQTLPQQQQQQFQQVPTTPNGVGQQTPYPGAQQNSLPQQFSPVQPHGLYRPQVQPQQHQQPILIHPHAHPQLTASAGGGPAQFIPPFTGHAQSHLIQSIPFYNPQGQMVLNHIPVMSNHHVIQMSPSQPIAIPVHVQLIPPVAQAAQLYQQAPPHQSQQQQQDGPMQAIPVRIMQPIPNPVHLYSPVNPFLPPLQAPQAPFHHQHHQHHPHHPVTITVTPKTTTSNYQHHQHHPRPAHTSQHAANQSTAPPAPTTHQAHHPSSFPHHPHPQQVHPHLHNPHSFNAIPTVFKFTSSNAIHPQKALGGVGGGSAASTPAGGPSSSSPTASSPSSNPAPNHRYNTPIVQISGPSISPTSPSAAHQQRHRFSTPGTTGGRSPSTAGGTPSPTPATRPNGRFTPAVGQVSGPTVSSTAANHRYAPLPTVPASPAGLREKFTAPAFQPAASESKQSPRKLEPPTNVADAVGSPSNAVSPKYESFGVENAVTPTAESLLLPSPSTAASSSASSASTAAPSLSSSSHSHSSASATQATASTPATRTTLAGGSFSYSNFIDTSTGAVSVTAKLTSPQTSHSQQQQHRSSSSTASFQTTFIPITTQATFIPQPKTYIQQLGPTIGVKFPPAFKSMPSVTVLPPQIETPISSTLKTYQYLSHHDTYDFIPSRVVELAHVKKLNGQKHPKRNKQNKHQKTPQKATGSAAGGGGGMVAMAAVSPSTNHHHHHVTVTSNKPLRFYPGDGPEYATHRPEAQLSVQLPPPEKEFTMTYYGTPKQNQKVQRPKNFVTPLHPYQATSTTPLPATLTTSAASPSSSTLAPASTPASSTTPALAQDFGRNVTTSTFRSATASSTAHYYKNRHEKSDDLTITTMRPRMLLKTIYRQFPGSFVSSSTSTEKPLQKWVPKRPRGTSTKGSAEFSTSTRPSSSLAGSVEQAVASSERDVVTKTPVQPVVTARSSIDQQVQRVRASRGRSRYTYRRIPSGNPPPIPTGQQQPHHQMSRTSRMRISNFNASATTTTIKPVAAVTSSVFDSNRIDGRSVEQQEPKAEETNVTATPNNGSNEKIKRDASEENISQQTEDPVREVTVAQQLDAKQLESKQQPLEVVEPEKEYIMVKANIEPVATNTSNVTFFEASDTTGDSALESGRAGGSSAFDELTMSIINHAKAIVNQTDKPAETVEDTTLAAAMASSGKTIESNEIAHKDEPEPESTIEETTPSSVSSTATTSPVETETTIGEAITTDTSETVADDPAGRTTVPV